MCKAQKVSMHDLAVRQNHFQLACQHASSLSCYILHFQVQSKRLHIPQIFIQERTTIIVLGKHKAFSTLAFLLSLLSCIKTIINSNSQLTGNSLLIKLIYTKDKMRQIPTFN